MPDLPRNPSRRSSWRPVVAALVAAIAVAAAAVLLPAGAAARNTPRLDARELAVIHRINLIRREHGLRALNASGDLGAAADRHSKRELGARTLAHQLSGEAPATSRVAAAARSKTVGEAVYYGMHKAGSKSIVRAFMASPPHRALLLSGDYGRAGVGIRIGRHGVYATIDVAGG